MTPYHNDHTKFKFQNTTVGLIQAEPNNKGYQYAFARRFTDGGHLYRMTPWMRCMEWANESHGFANGYLEKNGAWGYAYHPKAWEKLEAVDLAFGIGHLQKDKMNLDWEFISIFTELTTGASLGEGSVWTKLQEVKAPEQWNITDPLHVLFVQPQGILYNTRLGYNMVLRALRSAEWASKDLRDSLKNEPSYKTLREIIRQQHGKVSDSIWLDKFKSMTPSQFETACKGMTDYVHKATDFDPDKSAGTIHVDGPSNFLFKKGFWKQSYKAA